ncbi:MAG: NADH-quinone oxidoreductase subunit B family protein [Thermodesulfobacteriota bacterium]|mgnify:CR=1 FL=1
MNFLRRFVNKSRIKSPWLLHFDCGSCNGCDIEVLACLTPVYDVERFGIINVGNPKHADMLLVTGTVNYRNRSVLENIYNQMPDPKIVISVGSCGNSGGIFRDAYNVLGGIDKVIPVDIYVPGCPPKPEAIIDGVVAGLEILAQKDGRDILPMKEKLDEVSAEYSQRYENFKTGEEK